MQLEIGSIIEGKITGITKFGAFVTFADGRSGLVHISEIANTYVEDVASHVQVGQEVKVKVLAISDDGKINISIKKALEPEVRPAARKFSNDGDKDRRPQQSRPAQPYRAAPQRAQAPTGDTNFEDKLKQFMQDSDSRMAGNKMYADRKASRRKR
ncbi:MAG: S1 RNA-binding domain-containing protein [Ruminococcaceae bacterium]|nr:S1 RNA-binding domain-containing protein [Oscillospiraceae bacterium]